MGIPSIQQQALSEARAHQAVLSLSPYALGRMGDIACWFAARQGKAIPDDLKPAIVLFAADHAVAADIPVDGPDTAAQVRLIAEGRSAVSLAADAVGVEVRLVDVGVAGELDDLDGIEHARIAPGCGHLVAGPTMSQEDYWEAVGIGEEMANRAVADGANLLIAGDVGRGNCIAAAAVICHLTGLLPEDMLGGGAVAADRLGQPAMIAVEEALARARNTPSHDILRELGGYEMAAMAGFYRASARHGVPLLLDGFASAAAALAAAAWDVRIVGWMMAAHAAAYPGHMAALDEMGLEPLAALRLGAGQGLGAALLLPLLQSAITLHRRLPVVAEA